jgi:iron complex transport system ATP-binding protein
MFELRNVCIGQGTHCRLQNINLTIARGKLTAVLGANGAGKSTLLNTLAGELTPSQGEVMFKQKKLQHWNYQLLATQRAIMLQQQRPAFDFVVLDYLLLARHAWLETAAQRLIQAGQIIQRLALHHLLDKPVSRLSGGEWQRIQFARAWLQVVASTGVHHAMLLLDEPTAALDIFQQRQFYAALREFVDEGGTVLVVLHDLNQAARVADHFILLQQGSLLAAGEAGQTFTQTNLCRCFNVEGCLRQDSASGKSYFHYL